jgi:hypothetical protein
MVDEKPKIELKDAEAILKEAKGHLDKGKSIKALQIVKKADRTIDKTKDAFQMAIDSVENARHAVEEAKKAGLDTAAASEFLDQANNALLSGQYGDVRNFTRQCYTSMQKAMFIPGRELSVATKLEYIQGKTTLAITVENNTEYTIKTLKIQPELNNTPFLQETEMKVDLKPHREQKVVYNLTSTVGTGVDAKEKLLIGRDVTVETMLRTITKENKVIYAVWVTNNTADVISGLKIAPRLPEAFTPDSLEKIIDNLMPSEKKQIIFELGLRK